MSHFHSRFLAYARENGRNPADVTGQAEMLAYCRWIQARLAEWRKLAGKAPRSAMSAGDHRGFDSWLGTRAAKDVAVGTERGA